MTFVFPHKQHISHHENYNAPSRLTAAFNIVPDIGNIFDRFPAIFDKVFMNTPEINLNWKESGLWIFIIFINIL